MRVFKEEQAFRQWWLLSILGVVLLVTVLPLVRKIQEPGGTHLEILAIIPVLLIGLLFWKLKLVTRIDSSGIHTRFEPFPFLKKHFSWNEISECYVRQYSPIREYGGWGVRRSGKARAYNVSGNMGIQIITNDKKKFLIGTNKPEDVRRSLRYFKSKIN